MSMMAMAAPILPGKKVQWDQFVGELAGAKSAEFNTSRQRAGVRERTFLQQMPDGMDLVIVTLEGDDPESALSRIANEDTDFSRWFVQQVIEIHGFDLREALPGPPPRLVADSGSNGSTEHPAAWAQIIKMRLKSGQEEELKSLMEQLRVTEQPDSGLLRSTTMRDQKDPSSVYTMVVFESEEQARAREQDPRRDQSLQVARAKMAEMFDGPPEFVDLNVVGEMVTGGGTQTATAEENKALLRRLMDECFTQGNLDLIEELVSPDWVNIDPSLPAELRGHEGARQLITMWRSGFPDFQLTIDDMIAEGDKVAARFTFIGTHQSEFVGIPPTGKQIRGTGTGIFRFVDGKDVEHHVNFDALGLMQQVGVIPTPEPATA